MRRALGFVAIVVIALLAHRRFARAADDGAVSRDQGIAKLQDTRELDRPHARADQGRAGRSRRSQKPATATSRTSSWSRSRCGSPTTTLTIEAEALFAEIRHDDPRRPRRSSDIRDQIVELRGVMDDAERKLTDTGRGARRAHRRPVVPHHLPRGLRGRAAARRCCSATSRRRSRRSTCDRSSAAWRWPRWPRCSPCCSCATVFAAVARQPRGARGDHRPPRRGSALLRSLLAHRPPRAQALAGVRAGPDVERGVVGSIDVAGARRLHRGLPGGLRDRALLPGAAVVRNGPRLRTSSPDRARRDRGAGGRRLR